MTNLKTIMRVAAFLLMTNYWGVYALAKQYSDWIDKLHQGMTQQEVMAALGKPEFKRFNPNMEQWEYRRKNHTTEQETVILLNFQQGKLVEMNSYGSNDTAVPPYPPATICPPIPDKESPGLLPEQSEQEWIQQLIQTVRKEPFKDKQMEILYDIATQNSFSVDEIVQFMEIYTFDDDRMEVLEIMAPSLSERRNSGKLIEAFTFNKNRQKAREVLHRSHLPKRMVSHTEIEELYQNVKKAFPQEKKISTLRRGVMQKYVTCKQCIRLMSLCHFDNERIEFLKVLAPHIFDPYSSSLIVDSMNFLSGKKEAQEILDKY